jgi:hypothetical protein
MFRNLFPLLFLLTSAVYATENRVTHTFQAVECDDRDHSFTLVPVYFGTFFASPEVEVSAISNSKLIFSDPPGEWNVIARHGIEVEILGTESSETVVVIGVEKLGTRDDLWCSDDLIVRATVEAIKCTMRDQGINRFEVRVAGNGEGSKYKTYERHYSVGQHSLKYCK